MKPQEKKYLVDSLGPIERNVHAIGLPKVNDEVATHYYGQQEGTDVTKFVVYPNRVETHTLKDHHGTFAYGDSQVLANREAGFDWLQAKGFSFVDVVKMDYETYEYKGGTIGLYVINDELRAVILMYPPEQHTDVATEFGLDGVVVLTQPFNTYLKQVGKGCSQAIELLRTT